MVTLPGMFCSKKDLQVILAPHLMTGVTTHSVIAARLCHPSSIYREGLLSIGFAGMHKAVVAGSSASIMLVTGSDNECCVIGNRHAVLMPVCMWLTYQCHTALKESEAAKVPQARPASAATAQEGQQSQAAAVKLTYSVAERASAAGISEASASLQSQPPLAYLFANQRPLYEACTVTCAWRCE